MAEEQDKNPQTSETQAPEKDAGLGAEESGSEEKKSEKIDPKETAESKEAANDKEKAPKSAEDEPEKESEETEGKPDAEEAPGKPEEASEAEILTKKLKDSEDRYVHLMADFQNYKRRVEKEKADVYSFANEKMMTSLLQVMDNFERAVDQECSDEAYQKGMELIFKQLKELMEKEGLEEIEALGEEFDPNLHHAVLTDDNDEYGAGCVTQVLQKGYRLHDKVIRPSMVKVNN